VWDRICAVTTAHVDAAKEAIILERHSHIDSLITRLREPREPRVLEPMLAGHGLPPNVVHDDISYVLDMGLIRIADGEYTIANPIYREVLPLPEIGHRGPSSE